jgi:hypothetical protein
METTRNYTLENLEAELAWVLGCRTGDTPGVAYSDAAVEKLRQEIRWQESVARAKAVEEHVKHGGNTSLK